MGTFIVTMGRVPAASQHFMQKPSPQKLVVVAVVANNQSVDMEKEKDEKVKESAARQVVERYGTT